MRQGKATPEDLLSENKTCHEISMAYSRLINLKAPCFLYIGQPFRYSSENASYIFNQQIYFII